jgi:hypothetical protein
VVRLGDRTILRGAAVAGRPGMLPCEMLRDLRTIVQIMQHAVVKAALISFVGVPVVLLALSTSLFGSACDLPNDRCSCQGFLLHFCRHFHLTARSVDDAQIRTTDGAALQR